MFAYTPTPSPVQIIPIIYPIKPGDTGWTTDAPRLRQLWPFVERGLETILRKVKPRPTWLPSDVYSSLLSGQSQLCLAKRSDRNLGFFVWYLERDAWSGESSVFCWCAWTIPLKERIATDNIDEVVALTIQFLKSILGKPFKMVSSRPGFATKLGAKRLYWIFEF